MALGIWSIPDRARFGYNIDSDLLFPIECQLKYKSVCHRVWITRIVIFYWRLSLLCFRTPVSIHMNLQTIVWIAIESDTTIN